MMDIALQTKRGFTLLEMVVCVLIVSALLLLTLRNNDGINLEHYDFLKNYLVSQSQAILNKQDIQVGKGVYFNSMGHVNLARTIEFKNHKVIVHIGNGYATYE